MRSLVTSAARTVGITALALALTAVTAGAPMSADASERHAAPVHGATDRRGAILSDRPLTGAAALPGARGNRRVTYLSRGAHGEPITVSGTVALPDTPPPPGGWPVISWAHGTTGTADMCAPSADTADGPAHDYLGLVDRTLDAWVRRGFAVVQTDYEGLGTPGPHPYLNARSAADTVLDMVRAAHNVDHRVGRDWIAMGHSQGGHAALSAAAARSSGHDTHLLGAVSIAPGGVDVSRTASYIRSGQSGADAAVAFLPPLLIGAAAVRPGIVPDRLLTGTARPLLTAARTGCLAKVRTVAATISPDDVFRPGADLRPLTRYLRRQEPTRWTLRVPTFVAQGSDDESVSKASTDRLVKTLCTRYRRVSYRVYPNTDHRGAIAASLDDAERFVDALRSGATPPATCRTA